MRHHPPCRIWFWGCLAVLILAQRPLFAADPPLTIREALGQTWRNECVQFELTPERTAHVTAGHGLVGEDSTAIPYQIIPAPKGAGKRLVFAVDLDPFEERTFHFSETIPAATGTDLTIKETDDLLMLSNAQTGISLRRKLTGEQGPIEGIRLINGRWFGGSQLQTAQPVTSHQVEVIAKGPVFAEAICRVQLGEGRTWQMTFRLQANEPVVVVDETFSTGDEAAFRLALATDYAADQLFYRAGNDVVGRNRTWEIAPDQQQPVFVLEPWLHWWERDRQGNWFGLYPSGGGTLVVLGAMEPEIWVDPAQPAAERSPPQVFVTQEGEELWATFPLRSGRRKWMMGAFDQETGLALPPPTPVGRGEPVSKSASVPQKYVVKHGDFPLQRVLETTQPWEDKPAEGAYSLVDEARLRAFRQRYQVDPDVLAKARNNPVAEYLMDETVACYLATNDDELGEHLAAEAVRLVQFEVDNFYQQHNSPTLGAEPHRRANSLMPTVNLAALMLSREQTTAVQARRLKSQLAFLADTVARPDFYSQARGFSANPNMTSTVAAFQVRMAGAIPGHPRSADWAAGGMEELKRELYEWSDDNGGWLEAPHYALVAYDYMLGCFLAAHLAGQDDVLFDPQMKKVALWLAKISTPPDPAANGTRHHLPIGNTYQQESTSVYGHLAVLWREKDPQFSAEMQWMHLQQGEPATPGIGGFYPTLAGYRALLLNPDLPAKAPKWKSELFPESGVILRSGFPSDRETQMYLIAGRNHAHYDDDSGSFTLWGLGGQLASDFGYTGIPSAQDHNLLISPAIKGGEMRIEEFATTDRLDMVRGVRGAWTRQVAFVKAATPGGRDYFVLNDTLSEPAPLKWQIWLTADAVETKPPIATVRGQDDVNLDIIFAAPQLVSLRTEEKTRTCLTRLANGNIDTQATITQTGLLAEVSRGDRITTVLLPRLKQDPAAEVKSLAGGKVVRISSPAGTDYVFLSPKPFEFRDDDIDFEGTAGLVQIHGKTLTLALGAAGRIAAGEQGLKLEKAGSQSWDLPPEVQD